MANPASPTPEQLAFQKALAGRYSIEYELGRGGMGIVYLAREVALDRMVALKLLPPELAATPGVKERFLKEARTAARLSHPNIVQIYVVDEVEDFVFFAMAYVDGGTLGDRVRSRGPVSNSEAVRLIREVSWALAHAHAHGVVHRDVKPDNILLDQTTGRALVTDFGIALAGEGPAASGGAAGRQAAAPGATTLGTTASGATTLEPTAPRQVVGTAEFMSPEQATGAPVDARSDLYSLACVGAYALSGKVPFAGADPAAILLAHVRDPAPTVLSLAPHAPPAMASALDRCLRKDPEQRFQGGEALADALRPEMETDKELAVPLRIFIKQTRELENVVAWSGVGLAFAVPAMISAVLGVLYGGIDAGPLLITLAIIAVLLAVPVGKLTLTARNLLKNGFAAPDGTVAFLRDIDRKEEEFRFQHRERRTWVDNLFRTMKIAGFAGMAIGFAGGMLSGAAEWFMTFGLSSPFGWGGLMLEEIRKRSRGDVMGERYLKLWKSKFGKRIFELAGVGLAQVTPAIGSGAHRPTEVVIGLEADRLFAELPKETRKQLEGLPETVSALEEDAQAMRRQIEEMDGVLAEIGDDDPSRPGAAERSRVRAEVEKTRADAQAKLTEVVTALETIRLNLLYMHAGSGTVQSLTMELEAAKDLSVNMENLLEGHREVERILQERRKTGVFTIAPGLLTAEPDTA